jgi:hypothetical protein
MATSLAFLNSQDKKHFSKEREQKEKRREGGRGEVEIGRERTHR